MTGFRRLISKKENEVHESGTQKRTSDPTTPQEKQLWINTSTGKLKFYNGMVQELFESYVQGSKPSEIRSIPTTTIDWSLGSVFRKEVGGLVEFEFSNAVEGTTIYLIAIAAEATILEVDFEASLDVKKIATDNYELNGGFGLVTAITYANGKYFSKIIFRGNIGAWPAGSQGDLYIADGETIIVEAGSILDYDNVTIESGGILEIDGGNNAQPLLLGVAGDLVVEGEIRGRNATHNGGLVSIITPRGDEISFEFIQSLGGNGGNGASGGPGGAGTGGYGGGGSGGRGNATPGNYFGGSNGSPGYNMPSNGMVTLGNGGNGGNGSLNAPTSVPGGLGGSGGGSGGGRGKSGGVSGGSGGGGGGGGYKGKHGCSLYIYCLGIISGSGVIDLSALNGFNGGDGGRAGGNYSGGGGGGGSGAGGTGGSLFVRKPSLSGFTVPYNLDGGEASLVAGARGPARPGSPASAAGAVGLVGNDGVSGNIDVEDI